MRPTKTSQEPGTVWRVRDQLGVTAFIHAESWALALGMSIERLGWTGRTHRVQCEQLEDGSFEVTDSLNNVFFTMRSLTRSSTITVPVVTARRRPTKQLEPVVIIEDEAEPDVVVSIEDEDDEAEPDFVVSIEDEDEDEYDEAEPDFVVSIEDDDDDEPDFVVSIEDEAEPDFVVSIEDDDDDDDDDAPMLGVLSISLRGALSA